MIDWYSKVVLTIIAVALSGIFCQGMTSNAGAQIGNGSCGSAASPCYVATRSTDKLTIRIDGVKF